MAKVAEQWGTKVGVILAVAGSAVGLGNFLRFPGQAVENGGGAFMIPYFIALILLGIPICWSEWAMGRFGGQQGFNSAPGIYGSIAKRKGWRFAGVIGVLIPLVIYMYYVVIETWCLAYALYYLFGAFDLGSDPAQHATNSKNFFAQMVGTNADGALFSGGLSITLPLWLAVFTVNFILIFRGLSRGIETFCKYALPLMALCGFAVLARVLTLGTPDPSVPERSVINGLGFMWNPKPMDGGAHWSGALLDPGVWLAATGQVFFSLSVGFGIIVNYASYLKRKDDVVLSSLTASSTNSFFEVCIGGLITIPAAFIFLGAAGAVGGTFGLGFNTLPVVFEYMPLGHLFGFIWFFMLFLAAITSSLSMLQPGIAFLEETLGVERKASITLLAGFTALGSLFVLYFSKDLAALDTMDFWVGTFLIFVMAFIQVILFAWVMGVDRGIQVAEEGACMKLPGWFAFVIKYVAPIYLLLIFVGWCTLNLPGYLAALSEGGVPLLTLAVIGGILVLLSILAYLGDKRWTAIEGQNQR